MCGIAGIYSRVPTTMVPVLHDMMVMLQHRGNEAAGAVFYDGDKDWAYERSLAETGNSVAHFFKKLKRKDLKSTLAGAHTRYSTAGRADKIENVQPLFVKTKYGPVAIVHNGILVRAPIIKSDLEQNGECFASDSDTEVILKLIDRSKKEKLIDAVIESLETVVGSFSILIFCEEGMIAARDPFGFRPLSIAEFDTGYMFASETCAFDPLKHQMKIKSLRDVKPGEVIMVNKYGLTTLIQLKVKRIAQCIFELIYFSRPDSTVFGRSVDEFRELCGMKHAREHSLEVDCVIGVPDSANFFADGRAKGLLIPNERALMRNHASGRTFIDPNQNNRYRNVRLKLNPISRRIKDKRIDVCDDSLVRGNTIKNVIKMIKECDPKSISVSIGSPPFRYPCLYGIDTPDKRDLIATQTAIKKIAGLLDVDHLNYLSIESLKEIGGADFCYACFDGNYPL